MKGWDEDFATSAMEAAEDYAEHLTLTLDELVAAARHLLKLKDGPRDAAYEAAKPAAWERLRRAIPDSGGSSEQDSA